MTKKYTEKHEWVEIQQDGVAKIGISDFAQDQLGDVVFIDLPDVGAIFKKGDEMAAIESVKAASEIFAPISGEIVSVNDALEEQPDLVNSASESEGWLVTIKISDEAETENMMDEDSYKKFTSEQS